MSDIGFSELIILFVIGLLVLGPERLPRVASKLGGWLGQARRMTRVMKRQLEDELNFEHELNVKESPVMTPQDDGGPASTPGAAPAAMDSAAQPAAPEADAADEKQA